MIFKGIAPLSNLPEEPVKIEVFHSSMADMWTVQMKDEEGNQFDEAEYEYRKVNAIEAAERLMKEYKSINQIEVYTKEEKLQKIILRKGRD